MPSAEYKVWATIERIVTKPMPADAFGPETTDAEYEDIGEPVCLGVFKTCESANAALAAQDWHNNQGAMTRSMAREYDAEDKKLVGGAS